MTHYNETWAKEMNPEEELLTAGIRVLDSKLGTRASLYQPPSFSLSFSKKQYHGPYTPEQAQSMTGTMSTADALAKITVPALILKADAKPEMRKANEEAARVMQKGELIHIDGAGHNLHHDKLDKTVEVLNEFLKSL